MLAQQPQCGQRLLAALEQDDAFDDVAIGIHPHAAQPRLKPLVHGRDVLQEHRHAVALGDDHVLHVVERLQQPHASHVDALASEAQVVAADIGVAGVDRGEHLGQRDPVVEQFLGIDVSLVLARRAAERHDVDDSGDLLDLATGVPVLDRLQLVQGIAGPVEPVAVDLSDGRPGRELRREVVRQADELHAVQGFLPVREIFGAVREVELDVAQAEQTDGSRVLEARHTEQRRLDRHRDLPLHFLGGPRGILRDELDERRRRVGVRFHVEPSEGVDASRQPGPQRYEQ